MNLLNVRQNWLVWWRGIHFSPVCFGLVGGNADVSWRAVWLALTASDGFSGGFSVDAVVTGLDACLTR